MVLSYYFSLAYSEIETALGLDEAGFFDIYCFDVY